MFSRIENQPCADHDRATGEGAAPQEYTLIKIKVKQVPASWVSSCPDLSGKDVFFVAATLRPETMYGQTNCFVSPDGDYGMYVAFDVPVTVIEGSNKAGVLQRTMSREEALQSSSTVFICSKRSADNMGLQGIIPLEESKSFVKSPFCLKLVKGTDLMGLALSAPNAIYETVYSLPMFGISMEKGKF